MAFDDVKSETLNLRVSPSFKLALKTAAEHEQRSMVNMLEVLVAKFCQANGIETDEAGVAQTTTVTRERGRRGATLSRSVRRKDSSALVAQERGTLRK